MFHLCVVFIKIFGYPTGLGALIMRNGKQFFFFWILNGKQLSVITFKILNYAKVVLCGFYHFKVHICHANQILKKKLFLLILFSNDLIADAAKLLKNTYFSGGLCLIFHSVMIHDTVHNFVNLNKLDRHSCSFNCWHWLCEKKTRCWGAFWGWYCFILEHSIHPSWV